MRTRWRGALGVVELVVPFVVVGLEVLALDLELEAERVLYAEGIL